MDIVKGVRSQSDSEGTKGVGGQFIDKSASPSEQTSQTTNMVSSVGSKPVCSAVKKSGEACKAFAMTGEVMCRAHLMSSKGMTPFGQRVDGKDLGKVRGSFDPLSFKLSTKHDMQKLVTWLIGERVKAIALEGNGVSSKDLACIARLLGPFINISKLPDDKVTDAKVTNLADLMRLADAG